jgi:hypothetical protein
VQHFYNLMPRLKVPGPPFATRAKFPRPPFVTKANAKYFKREY